MISNYIVPEVTLLEDAVTGIECVRTVQEIPDSFISENRNAAFVSSQSKAGDTVLACRIPQALWFMWVDEYRAGLGSHPNDWTTEETVKRLRRDNFHGMITTTKFG